MNVAAADQVDPGDRHQPADLGPLERLLGDQPLDRGDLAFEEVDVADPGVDRLALLDRKLHAGQPPATLDPEQVRARRLALQPALQHGMDLVLRA